MIHFFINGMFFYEKNNWYMRFLTETSENISIHIYKDESKKILLSIDNISVNKCSVLPINILIGDSDLLGAGVYYKRYYYNVIGSGSENDIKFTGSFPIITRECDETIKFGFVSCNDNLKKVPFWNTYHSGVSSVLWDSMYKKNFDIIIHSGDQIYADSVCELYLDNIISLKKVKKYLRFLYRNTFSEKSQSRVMRNCLNIMLLDDHDIADSYGTPTFKKVITNKIFDRYRNIAIKYYEKYQCGLINIKFNDKDYDYSYTLDIGKYKIFMIDMRNQLYKTGQAFSSKILSNITKELKSNTNTNSHIIFVLPRPIGGTSKFYSWLGGFYMGDCIDEPMHPDNIKHTEKLLDIIFKYKYNTNANMLFISGDVHETYKKNIVRNINEDKIKISQYICSGITRSTRNQENIFIKTLFWITDNFNNLKQYGIGEKLNLSHNNNYGQMINDKIKLFNKELSLKKE